MASLTPVLERLVPPPEAGPASAKPRPWKLLLLGCLGLAALSLTLPSVPTYDPWAWIIWGREIAHLDLVTTTGPSWKPLPVIFTTPFSLAGDDGAPLLWLVVARAGGILAFAMAFRLGNRLAGPFAGAIAAAALILADEFIRNFARGNSEGLLVALALWAIERHLDGRRRDAFLLGIAAALLRPEVWPFIALYGLFLIAADRRPATVALVLGGGLSLLILWFVPEYFGSGDFLRAAERARQPNPDSAAFADHPFIEVFDRSSSVLSVPVYVGGVLAVLVATHAFLRHRAQGVRLAMAAIATVLMVSVAAMTQAGFAGNLRYVALPAAFVCVLSGAGWVWLVRAANARLGTVAACALVAVVGAASVPFVRDDIGELDRNARQVKAEATLYGTVPDAIAAGGGEAKLKSCGAVYTGAFQTQAVAWYMHLHQMQSEIFAFPPGTTIAPSYSYLARDPRFPEIARTRKWVIGTSCRG
ncbi:MAG TPA: glycosyltransferase 87 family protein [Solirubrobacter sp.]|nr:glycosyltransferase 87 family protein [Solirubrobacter sp.]